jgi:hypothetical protein
MSKSNCDKETISAVINSARRLNSSTFTETSSNFTYSFNDSISRIDELVFTSVQVPYTFFIWNSNNNVLTFNGGAVSVTITPGSYSMSSLTSMLQTNINTAFGDATTLVTYNISTFRITISRGTSFIIDSVNDQATSTASTALGFTSSTTSGTTATAQSVANISGPNYILVESDCLAKARLNKTIYADNSYRDVILVLPVDVSYGDIITLTGKIPVTVSYSYKLNILSTDKIDIKITDENHNVIDLNGSEATFHITFISK